MFRIGLFCCLVGYVALGEGDKHKDPQSLGTNGGFEDIKSDYGINQFDIAKSPDNLLVGAGWIDYFDAEFHPKLETFTCAYQGAVLKTLDSDFSQVYAEVAEHFVKLSHVVEELKQSKPDDKEILSDLAAATCKYQSGVIKNLKPEFDQKYADLAKKMAQYLSHALSVAVMETGQTLLQNPSQKLLDGEFNHPLREVLTKLEAIRNIGTFEELQKFPDSFQQYETTYVEAFKEENKKKSNLGQLVNYGDNMEVSNGVFLDFWSGGLKNRVIDKVSAQVVYNLAAKDPTKINFENFIVYSHVPESQEFEGMNSRKEDIATRFDSIKKKLDEDHLTTKDFSKKVIPEQQTQNQEVELIWDNKDTVVAARDHYENTNKKSTAILNFADANEPGAGWWFWEGAFSQEEAVCRQTDVFFRLNFIANQVYKDAIKAACGNQELKLTYRDSCPTFDVPERGVILLKDVQVLTKNPQGGKPVEPADDIIPINVIVSAALDYSTDTWGGGETRADIDKVGDDTVAKRVITKYELRDFEQPTLDSDEYKDIQKSKIRAQLYSAIVNGIKVIILGNQGGGVFKNHPLVVGDLYAQVLFGEDMIKYFDRVVITDKNRFGSTLTPYIKAFLNYFNENYQIVEEKNKKFIEELGEFAPSTDSSALLTVLVSDYMSGTLIKKSRRRLRSLDSSKLQELRDLLYDAFPEEKEKAKPVFSGKHRR